MAQQQVDLIDVGALVIFPVMASFVLGVFSFGLNIFGGYDFATPLWEGAGAEISVALILTVASIGWIVATNELDGSNYEQWEYLGIAGVFLLVPLYSFVPAFQSLLDASDAVKFVAWIAIAAVAVWISYSE